MFMKLCFVHISSEIPTQFLRLYLIILVLSAVSTNQIEICIGFHCISSIDPWTRLANKIMFDNSSYVKCVVFLSKFQ